MRHRWRRGILALMLFVAPAAEGRQLEAVPADQSALVQQLGRLIERQQSLIEEQGRRLDDLQHQLDGLRVLVAGPQAIPPAPVASTPVESEPEAAFPEIPPDVVKAGDFPGSFNIPGTNAAVKLGGLVRVNWVTTFNPLLVSDRFITSDIPVDVTDAPTGRRVDVIAIPSRFNTDFRTPTGVGYLRAFIEGDFGGSGNTFRLRHAYGQWRRFLFGQTWSTFADPEAEPDGIDFEGLNAAAHFRQPQARFTWAVADRVRVALALEDPNTEVSGATAANQRPDFVSRIRWESRRGGHIQAAALVRQLAAYPSSSPGDIVNAGGWGVNVSGRLPSPVFKARDLVLFQFNRGTGIGHYITDLNSEGAEDGVFDTTTNTILALPVFSGFASYEHWWSGQLHSALTAGLVDVTRLAVEPSTALYRTYRYSGNMIWSPVPRLELVTELLYGIRLNKDLHRESALQLQVGSTFRF